MSAHFILFLTLFSSHLLWAASKALPPVIYGEDNRIDVAFSTNDLFQRLARSTATQVLTTNLKSISKSEVVIGGKTLIDDNWCPEERFSTQPAGLANCSGFLIASDILVTAGHCVESEIERTGHSWVFDYVVENEYQSEVIIKKSNVYKLKKVLSTKLTEDGEDYAVIKLDRAVPNREFLKYRKSGMPKVGDKLVVIGNPWGLPTKIADGANIRSIDKYSFKTDLDTYHVNSGSAVFNADTGIVEGILVRGETDYKMTKAGCRISNVFEQNSGGGEAVSLIGKVLGL